MTYGSHSVIARYFPRITVQVYKDDGKTLSHTVGMKDSPDPSARQHQGGSPRNHLSMPQGHRSFFKEKGTTLVSLCHCDKAPWEKAA